MKLVIDASEEDTSSKVGSGVAENEEEDQVEEEPQCLNYCNRASGARLWLWITTGGRHVNVWNT